MAASGRSRKDENKAIRQEALRESLAAGGHIQHVLDIAEKLSDLLQPLENSEITRLKSAADIKLKLINKYLPDAKHDEDDGVEDKLKALADSMNELANRLPD